MHESSPHLRVHVDTCGREQAKLTNCQAIAESDPLLSFRVLLGTDLCRSRPRFELLQQARSPALDNTSVHPHMAHPLPSYFHLHLVSDATGETLTTIAKAAAVQYSAIRPIEHVYPLVRTRRQIERVLQEIASAPGIVLYTVVNKALTDELERHCKELKVPCLHVLEPIMKVFEGYLGAPQTPVVAGQHVLDADYFRRIDALNFTMAHDDGRLPEDLNDADIIILGISRTSKTPTSIYLAQRGYKTTNLPIVPSIPLPPSLSAPHRALVVGLVASPERIAEIRRNRVRLLSDRNLDDYVDRNVIAQEIVYSRRLCAKHGWPVIDVTRRSVEETAATILQVLHDRDAAASGAIPAEAKDA